MINPKDKECLEKQKLVANQPIDKDRAWKEIDHYRKFFSNKHKVPRTEIFYGACIDSDRLRELCDNPKIKIYIAKSSDKNEVDDFEDFKFIIMGADEDGFTVIEEDKAFVPNPKMIDICCCRNPPRGRP